MANTCTALLLKLRECKNFRLLLQIHSSLIVSGLKPHNPLINAYSLFQRPDLSRIIFNSVQDPGVVLWNSMIRGYTRAGLHREALEFFGYMSEKKGIDPDKYTFTFALKACRSMDLEEGLRVHDLVAEMGFESDVYIGTGLVEMYCKAGDLVSARQVFDKMPVKDIVTWNTMVSGLAQNGCPGEALRLFRDLHLSCVGIDHVSLYNLIPAVSKLGKNDVCRCLHGLVVKKGFTSAFSSGLIDMYCKCGELYASESVFEEVWSKDDSSGGTMMAAYAHNGSFEEVLKLFEYMRRYDVRMNKVAVASALQAAAYVGDLVKGISIHEYAVQQGMMSDVLVATSLMNMYSKCRELEIAEQLFTNMKDRDVVSWSAMIASFEQAGHHDATLSLFRDMVKIHVKPNAVTLTSVLPACAGIAACRLGKSIHCHAIKADIESELEIATAIISMYAKSGCFSPALKAFERLPIKDAVAFNALAQGYTQIGDASKAFDVYNNMKLHGVCPDSGTMVGMLQTCALCSDYARGSCVYGKIIKHGLDSECHVANALIDLFTKCDALTAAKSLFDKCGFEKSTLSWNIMMNGYLLHGQPVEAIATFSQMKVENFQPNTVTFVNILRAIAELTALRVGMSVHASLIRFGVCSHTSVGNSLVDMYAKCGMIDSSERCFIEIRNKVMVSWNTLLSAYAAHGLASSAVSLFLSMQENELKPDSVSFLSVLSACRHAGLVEEGKQMFKEIEERHKMKAEVEHYACMVDLLGKAGLFGEAVDMVRRMRVKASVGVWGALLNSSRMHCNLWLSNAALCQLVKLEPLNPSHYCQDGRLGEANNVSRIKMAPACSWIQV
ncbi:PREDICTED: LOW QUALITY PROTEIN: pentatricopeptide repeat-containing protein At2g39620-like [Camelina sativa]|uniref:LOW QUALITY PROTEIN: pentatricopeptide repeat-containing protein At2g39620-like n=1 Tax=Camelina sativa TaxID=90675 RepID=A0ABM1RU54_CAMSA|nr:PREDICTED: LOW QUALITY PROTEIN: pentatricopeptide repeat-containing protein At2g39620-like [Camelina sativa]